jgi:hypothetical protein
MTDLGGITRQFSMEGATHLYSSLPVMLTPADLYRVKDNPAHKAALLNAKNLRAVQNNMPRLEVELRMPSAGLPR